MSLQVIGSGLGRTGTYSLKLALEQLGFNKCYHMAELFQHTEGVVQFENAESNKPVDWDKLFDGYTSAVDYPVARYYKQLMQKYPQAKIIHTIRDEESWYQSASKTIIWASKPSVGRILKLMIKLPFSPVLRKQMAVLKFNGKLIDREFGSDYKNKESVIAHYRQHNEEVMKTVPPERLLVYNVRDGWEPLCKFLNVPVPTQPFPKTNSRDEFIGRIKNIKKQIEI